MTVSSRDILSGAVMGAGAIGLYAYTAGFPVREGQAAAVSPGFYPRLLAVILALLAAGQIVSAIRAARRARAQEATDDPVPPLWKSRRALGLFLLTLALLVAYPFLLELFGFAVTGVLFLGVLITALSRAVVGRSRGEAIVIGAVTLAIGLVTVLVFRTFLNIPFPRGIIFGG